MSAFVTLGNKTNAPIINSATSFEKINYIFSSYSNNMSLVIHNS